jgi:hypothetical protein
MIRKSFLAIAASLMTLTAFSATLTVMGADAAAEVQSA